MTILIHPGLGGSGPDHWQSLWQRANPDFVRVEQHDWKHPVCQEWVQVLDGYVLDAEPGSLLVAHSLGCHTLAHWALNAASPQAIGKINGALLVAPPDLDAPDPPALVLGFNPVPMMTLPFATIVVASSDDPYATIAYSRDCARAWGSAFESVGALGHINAESGIGEWREGLAYLQRLG